MFVEPTRILPSRFDRRYTQASRREIYTRDETIEDFEGGWVGGGGGDLH